MGRIDGAYALGHTHGAYPWAIRTQGRKAERACEAQDRVWLRGTRRSVGAGRNTEKCAGRKAGVVARRKAECGCGAQDRMCCGVQGGVWLRAQGECAYGAQRRVCSGAQIRISGIFEIHKYFCAV
ncbi:hypothetical protein CYMTET_54412 [Cymbomonas tetramitiformis]|uniref:Uncharacterized protein n=1 Tax=Cymbomonas tetramitiformis TaxID=36881 RepID=A0AAE0BF77_9CHLO|nr:hypothetical protein CYMTET_54412 [Cymbomonas tetramitiformis]